MTTIRFDRRRPARAPRRSNLPPGDDVDQVERLMTELAGLVGERPDRVGDMACEQLACGGKRLRARLALAGCEALGASRADGVIWAAAVEILHNATLVHDDVQDGDRMRRGRPALWVRHGTAQALNAGNYMLMLPYRAVSRIASPAGARLSAVLADHAIATVRGQVAELDLLPDERLDWTSWAAAARGKTGAMFALPIFGAAILAAHDDARAACLADPFADLGLAFQVADDLLDLYGDKGREKPGCDLYEGKVSALVVEHLARRPADRNWLLDLLRAPREATPAADVNRAIEAFRASGAADAAAARASRLVRGALAAAPLAREPRLRAVAADLAERCTATLSIHASDVTMVGVA